MSSQRRSSPSQTRSSPSQTRSSSRMSSATRKIQRSYRGFKSRKLIFLTKQPADSLV